MAQHLCLVVLGDRLLAALAVIGRRLRLALRPAQPLELQPLTLAAVRGRHERLARISVAQDEIPPDGTLAGSASLRLMVPPAMS